ncbi:protein SENSITIVE TO UV 2 isoform X2 [Macadamia integrifolia]|uniref:protein SENSITIVE TO UV 2 isoform X2 n=1 Tax=Macadamia integrifolia TaxID=60698 RepID=UPI001C4F07BC|nr:protein SENSITIVE TO UV 2 isoform X2 [Macadamia integrifolia]
MSLEGFDDWDELFLDQAIRMEEVLISMSSTNPTQHQPHQQQQQQNHEHRPTTVVFDPPQSMLAASQDPFTSFSPPREFSQRLTDKDPQQSSITSTATRPWNLSPPPPTRRPGKEKEVEIGKLKKELGRASKQLSQLEQECVELQKNRDKAEEQLRSAFTQIREKDAEIQHLKRINVGREYGAAAEDRYLIYPQCQNADTLADLAGPRINSALTSRKAVGVQTETSYDNSHLMRKNDLSSQHDLSKKLLSVWGYPRGQVSSKDLVSKLVVTCAEDLHVLFRFMNMNISSEINQDSLADKKISNVSFHGHMQSAQSTEASKISRLYFLLTKISNEMVQLDSLFKALLDLCILENVVIAYRTLRIVHVILQHLSRFDWRFERRDNVIAEGICTKRVVDLHESEGVHSEDQFGLLKDKSVLSNHASSSVRSFSVEILSKKDHENPTNMTFLSRMDWISLFEMMHRIAVGSKEEHVQVEALSILNMILTRSDPYSEREKYGLGLSFTSISLLLRKEIGLRVREQALRLLFLLLNCPKLLMMFCSGCKDGDGSAGDAPDGPEDASAFQGFGSILEGLAECLACSGNGTLIEEPSLFQKSLEWWFGNCCPFLNLNIAGTFRS